MARTVLLLHPSSGRYGADLQLYGLATGLDRGRYRPLVVLPEPGQLGPMLAQAGVDVHYAPVAALRRDLLRGRGLGDLAGALSRQLCELRRLARDEDVSIVHSNSSIVLGGRTVAAATGAPHLMHVREIYAGIPGRPGAGGRLTRQLWRVLRRHLQTADALACVSRAVARQFAGFERAFVLPDAAVRSFRRRPRAAARAALGVPDGAFVVGVIGRLSDWKGQDTLVRALADPRLAAIGAIAVLAGDAAPGQAHHEHELRGLIRSLGLESRVRLLGFCDDIDPVLSAADVIAVPSTHPEGLPNAALEAAAAGVPLVGADCGGIPEIVRDGTTGRLFEPGDSDALAATLDELHAQPEQAAGLGEAAARDVARRFDRTALISALQVRYDALCSARPARVRSTTWLLSPEPMPVSVAAAPHLRWSRVGELLSEQGHAVIRVGPQVNAGDSHARPRLRAWRQAALAVAAAPRLALRAARERPALVATNTALHAPTLALIKLRLGGRVTVLADVMGLRSLETRQTAGSRVARSVQGPAWRALERVLFARADIVLTVNRRHAQLLSRRRVRGRIAVVRDGAEAELATLAAADRSTLGLPLDAWAVGFLGSLVCSRLNSLLGVWEQSLSELTARLPGRTPCLVVIGDGPDLPAYRRRAQEAGWLGRSVYFLGALERMRALSALRACDVAFSECWSDAGLPFKLYEYMALGMPILVEGKPQISELLTDGRDALFFNSPDHLAHRLCELASRPELAARLGSAAQQSFLAGHTLADRRRCFAAAMAAPA